MNMNQKSILLRKIREICLNTYNILQSFHVTYYRNNVENVNNVVMWTFGSSYISHAALTNVLTFVRNIQLHLIIHLGLSLIWGNEAIRLRSMPIA